MLTKKNWRKLVTGNYSSLDIAEYFIGMYRYKIYYSYFRDKLIRTHIREQINFRIIVMDKECLSKGNCKMCGCLTTALQMSNKMCDKPCYPIMMSKKQWEFWKRYKYFLDIKNNILWKTNINGKLMFKKLCYANQGHWNS